MSNLKFAIVKGSSMSPLLKEGDLIGYKNEKYNKGDIITFKLSNCLITHRLIDCEKKIITKGDNFPFLDKAINGEDILGVVQFVLKQKSYKVYSLKHSNDNYRFLLYALIEINTITFFSQFVNSKYVNYFVKKIYWPFYLYNYFIFSKRARIS